MLRRGGTAKRAAFMATQMGGPARCKGEISGGNLLASSPWPE